MASMTHSSTSPPKFLQLKTVFFTHQTFHPISTLLTSQPLIYPTWSIAKFRA
ncbi:hypothetical protein AHAS_Ahas03G0280700 [Arachis hypogaea]